MKRGSSGFSLLVGVNKPVGMSSHDAINRVRRIFGERRCGHTGTLDPFASGVLPVCVGPATRLDQYMTAHDKSYRVSAGFGFETTTDDIEGDRLQESPVPSYLFDEEFARDRIRSLVRTHTQVPPQYSAIKVNGKKAYEIARAGGEIELEPRVVEVYDATLIEMREGGEDVALEWVFDVSVSKGTYIRSLVRDLGREVLCPAHVRALARTKAGAIGLERCVSLESLENLGVDAALDPVEVLGLRFAFVDDYERFVQSGTKLYPNQVNLYEPLLFERESASCPCTSSIVASVAPPTDGELACMIVANRLKALYRFDGKSGLWVAECVFSTAIQRG